MSLRDYEIQEEIRKKSHQKNKDQEPEQEDELKDEPDKATNPEDQSPESNFNLEPEKKNLYQKFKTEKKFRAKAELIFYGAILLIIILGAQLSSLFGTNNYTPSSNTTTNQTENEPSNSLANSTPQTDLYKELNDYYNANIKVIALKDGTTSTREYTLTKEKTDPVSTPTLKKINSDTTETTYTISDTEEFYTTTEPITQIPETDIFDLVSYKYLNLTNLKKYIAKGTTDYVTNYSNGTELTSYKIPIKTIILDNTTDDYITINVTTTTDTVTFKIDYTNLLKNSTIDSCNVEITYTTITA